MRYHLLLFRERLGERPEVDETVLEGEAPAAYVERMARAKAEAGWNACCSETCRTRRCSPPIPPWRSAGASSASRATAPRRPRCSPRSGERHEVLTGSRSSTTTRPSSRFDSEVLLKKLSPEEIAQYVASGEGDDKAGAYAIQGRAARFIVELRGSYSGVMGLPLYETSLSLDKLRGRNSY